MKILLVDDDVEKTRLVTECLLETGKVQLDELTCCMSVLEAKRRLKETFYDLMILDINLPARPDRTPEFDSGGGVYRWLWERAENNFPGHVIGLSAYEAGVELAAKEFEDPFWKIVRFAADEADWKSVLQKAVISIDRRSRVPPVNDGRTYHVLLGIVVGLEGVELSAVLARAASYQQVVVPHDPIQYFRGVFVRGGKTVEFVAAAPPKMGLVHSAVVTTKLIETFRPEYIAMSGICAGVREETALGDILVADPCWDWGSGKIQSDIQGQEYMSAAPYQFRLDATLRSVARSIAQDEKWRDAVYMEWTESRPDQKPKILIEAVASGATVLQRKASMVAIKKQHKNLIGVEMEIYAVLAAAELASDPRPTAFAAKSVCDLGEEDKDGKMQKYAAYTSARFLEEMCFRALAAEAE